MADLSQIQVDGTDYDIKDATARADKMDNWDLLWTNASPLSSFAAQTVSLTLSGYDLIALTYVEGNEHSLRGENTIFLEVDNILKTQTAGYLAYLIVRKLTVSTTGITFSVSTKYSTYANTNGSDSGNYFIPYKIYGIKGVS